MKKFYVKPVTHVVKIESSGIIAGSDGRDDIPVDPEHPGELD